jgi:hypothetical protein
MVKSAHLTPFADFSLRLKALLFQVKKRGLYIAWIGFVLQWMIEPLIGRMRVLAFEAEWTVLFSIISNVFAVLRPV